MRCEAPERVAGRGWRDISSQEFACSPQTVLSEEHIQTVAGRDQTIQCRVKGDRNIFSIN